MIRKCTCTHKGQDSIYGKGMRVFNDATKESKYRCTVCLKEEGWERGKKR